MKEFNFEPTKETMEPLIKMIIDSDTEQINRRLSEGAEAIHKLSFYKLKCDQLEYEISRIKSVFKKHVAWLKSAKIESKEFAELRSEILKLGL